MTIALPITSLTAALLALGFLRLSYAVTRHRVRTKASLGDGDDEGLTRSVRAQGNFVEYTPFFLVLLALSEANGVTGWWLAPLGAAFIAGRVMHAHSLTTAERREGGFRARFGWRMRGMQTTFGCLLAAALTAGVSGLLALL